MAEYKGPASESSRVMQMKKRRERHAEEMEIKKKKLAEDLKFDRMDKKFSAHYDAVETNLKSSTVGLLTMEEMKNVQEAAVREREKLLAQKSREELQSLRKKEKAREAEKNQQKAKIKNLSFNPDEEEEEDGDQDPGADDDDDEEEEEEALSIRPGSSKSSIKSPASDDALKKKRFGKNPDVDTSFLPDIDREEEENQLREKLRQEWEDRQKKTKEEPINITFSYWDGSGHRRSITMRKGQTIYHFLHKSLEVLRTEFSELRSVTADQLMYVKEDLIIPQTNTFYDFIVTKARGKTGPLFNFDVHEDVRLVNDASVEKDESHAGKVVLRSWYERNKHIFPASRWEPFSVTR